MKKINKVVNYRKWIYGWGLLEDQQKIIQKYVDKENEDGWHLIQIELGEDRINIFFKLYIFFIRIVTLGFAKFETGAVMVFEKEA